MLCYAVYSYLLVFKVEGSNEQVDCDCTCRVSQLIANYPRTIAFRQYNSNVGTCRPSLPPCAKGWLPTVYNMMSVFCCLVITPQKLSIGPSFLTSACFFLLNLMCMHIFNNLTAKSFAELVRYLFKLPDVASFLSLRICQDPIGCQHQKSSTHVHLTSMGVSGV